ncbi:glycine zipper 2TM domain-containing protein [Cupriavidus sp. IDO]|uniref:glycine zipper 2TM domain-containing protein n=1 Tax=Cupriavidus sp. IDO TaxID=1539142 RepID=UPI0009E43788|nr:glycine zipper 2TM domain-containing protein [Cupriavidus sp. IDO]
MKRTQIFLKRAAILIAALGIVACSGMSRRDTDTVVGAGIGGVAGAVLTSGSALGTVGGAAVGGVIGNQVGK